jgi:hypothetical protein
MEVGLAKACDTAQQQTLGIRKLGHEYVAFPHRPRLDPSGNPAIETYHFRMVGAVDGTTLAYGPLMPPGAPATLDLGEVVEITTSSLDAGGAFTVTSQDEDHPFYLFAYMTGGESFQGQGDPEWVGVVPAAQFLDRYVFFTDPTYPETSLAVVRAPGPDGAFADVELPCLGTVTGWAALGEYEVAYVQLVTGNFEDVGSCTNGRHEMRSEQPFGVTIWGWGSAASGVATGDPGYSQFVSYAYPAGMGVGVINDVFVPAVPK